MAIMSPRNRPCSCGSGKKYKNCKCSLASGPTLQPLQNRATPLPKRDQDFLIVAMPTRGAVSIETVGALLGNMDGFQWTFVNVARKKVVEARNTIAGEIRRLSHENPWGFVPRETYVLWCDSDAWWPPNTIAQAAGVLRQLSSVDLLAGFHGGRVAFSRPFAYRDFTDANSYPKPGIDCAFGDVLEITHVGFHWVMHRVSLLERIGDDPFTIPEGSPTKLTEDFAFCERVRAAGGRIACATGLQIAHVDPDDGSAYIPGMPAFAIRSNQIVRLSAEHLGFDGRHKFPEQRTYGLPALEQEMAEVAEKWKAASRPHE